MRQKTRTPLTASAAVLICVVAGALLSTGAASAASRGFKLRNESDRVLHLQRAEAVPYLNCDLPQGTGCMVSHYDMAFEGRPDDGAELHPNLTHTWELKYRFSITGGVQYAANLVYNIDGGGRVEYTIETWPTSNDSECQVFGQTARSEFSCTAEGRTLTFRRGGRLKRRTSFKHPRKADR